MSDFAKKNASAMPDDSLGNMSDDELIEKAIAAYFRHARRAGVAYDQPSPPCCVVMQGCVILRNNYGELARFKRCKKRFVRIRYQP